MFKKLKRKKEDKKKKNEGSGVQDIPSQRSGGFSVSKENVPTAAMVAKSLSAPSLAPTTAPLPGAPNLPEQGVRAVALYDYQPEQEDEIALQGKPF